MAKRRINIHLDEDVIEYFKERASLPNSAPYQTLINNVLREEVLSKSLTKEFDNTLSLLKRSLLEDQEFINSVSHTVRNLDCDDR
jgi:hypothetical protein